jgi:transcriptional regulator
MHTPKVFQQNDSIHLQDIIVNYPFATLIIHSENGIEVNHIPFFLDKSNGKCVLQGHIAKANPLSETVNTQAEVVLIFHGPNCYISPNFYPTKKENGKAVPTWNYIAVHVRGVMTYRFDEDFKLTMLDNLTQQHEATQATPWSIYDTPEQYLEHMLPAIVGLEIQITSITGQWKVSQNQPEVNKQGIVKGLNKTQISDAHKIAMLVQAHTQITT